MIAGNSRQAKPSQLPFLDVKNRPRKRKHPRPIAAPTTTISLADVNCEHQLGGLLKHYHRKAA